LRWVFGGEMIEEKYVNLGCGERYREEWLNFDLNPRNTAVTKCDLLRGIPLAAESCDVVYHSHVLEHLRPDEARSLLGECYRVLKPEGVLRVVVPDLEQICRLYIKSLEEGVTGNDKRTWVMLEMYDQCVREKSGGDMREYLARPELPEESFIHSRIGEEYLAIRKSLREERGGANASFSLVLVRSLIHISSRLRGMFGRLLLGRAGVEALKVGRFRQSGEIHHWMYDRLSLAEELRKAGFSEAKVQDATTSYIARWQQIGLDALPDGTPIKPDSLYMEGIKSYDKQRSAWDIS